MSRSLSRILAAAVILCGLVATAEAQSRQRRSRVLRGPAAGSAPAVRPTGSTTLTVKGNSQIVAQLPDLQIARVTPDQDGRPPQKITVVNGGGMTASSYDLRVTVYNGYGRLAYEIIIPNRKPLARGASITLPLHTTGYGASWSVKLDPDNRVREGNEKNNRWANNRFR